MPRNQGKVYLLPGVFATGSQNSSALPLGPAEMQMPGNWRCYCPRFDKDGNEKEKLTPKTSHAGDVVQQG
jgi:hypothetical protein